MLGLDLQDLVDITAGGFQNALGVGAAGFAHNFDADGGRIDDGQSCLLLQAEDRRKEFNAVQLATERFALHLRAVGQDGRSFEDDSERVEAGRVFHDDYLRVGDVDLELEGDVVGFEGGRPLTDDPRRYHDGTGPHVSRRPLGR